MNKTTSGYKHFTIPDTRNIVRAKEHKMIVVYIKVNGHFIVLPTSLRFPSQQVFSSVVLDPHKEISFPFLTSMRMDVYKLTTTDNDRNLPNLSTAGVTDIVIAMLLYHLSTSKVKLFFLLCILCQIREGQKTPPVFCSFLHILHISYFSLFYRLSSVFNNSGFLVLFTHNVSIRLL